jgi:hypothetical protein
LRAFLPGRLKSLSAYSTTTLAQGAQDADAASAIILEQF